MKRSLLIAGGTLGGLGAVLAITPPNLTSSVGGLGMATGTPTATAKPSASASASSTPTTQTTAKPTAKATTSAKPKATKSATAAPTATPTPVATTPSSGINGTFTGAGGSTGQWGNVVVTITVKNSVITAVKARQDNPSRSQQAFSRLIPETLQAQSSAIHNVSRVSYSSYGFYLSLQSALTKAGLPL